MSNLPDNNQPDHIVDMHEMVTDTNQASEEELKSEITRIYWMIFAGADWERTPIRYQENGSMDVEEAREAIQDLIRTEKLKLLAAVRERVVDKPTGNHNADSLLERDVLIYNQATAYLRTELTKLEAEL